MNILRDSIAVAAMQSIIADPEELPLEKIQCPECKGTRIVACSDGIGRRCCRCNDRNGNTTGQVEATCARSVAIKAVRYADELIAELERTKV